MDEWLIAKQAVEKADSNQGVPQKPPSSQELMTSNFSGSRGEMKKAIKSKEN